MIARNGALALGLAGIVAWSSAASDLQSETAAFLKLAEAKDVKIAYVQRDGESVHWDAETPIGYFNCWHAAGETSCLKRGRRGF
jgi:hypothetical protein